MIESAKDSGRYRSELRARFVLKLAAEPGRAGRLLRCLGSGVVTSEIQFQCPNLSPVWRR